MAKYLLLVVTNPVPGREAEYNHWYSNVHLGEVLQVPGYVGARRYQIISQPAGNVGGKYAALYEMECDDAQLTYDALGKANDAGLMQMSGALDPVNISVAILRPL